MWVWNDYLLPYLVLDSTKYKTIPIHIQYLKGSYGSVDMGATMALILMSIVPVVIFYLCCQKYIIKGVAAGAVKGCPGGAITFYAPLPSTGVRPGFEGRRPGWEPLPLGRRSKDGGAGCPSPALEGCPGLSNPPQKGQGPPG